MIQGRRQSEYNVGILNVIACLCSAQIIIVQSVVDMYNYMRNSAHTYTYIHM